MNRPLGATILALLAILRGLVSLLAALVGFGMSAFVFLTGYSDPAAASLFWAIGRGIAGLVVLGLGYGLWQVRGWAWMWTVLIILLDLVLEVITIFTGGSINWFSFLLSLAILIVLFLPGVRSAYLDGE